MGSFLRSPAAETALIALWRAVASGGELRLAPDEPASAWVGDQARPLGRNPLSKAAIETLLASPQLAQAVAQGPSEPSAWPIDLGAQALEARVQWLADGKWAVHLRPRPTAPPQAAAVPLAAESVVSPAPLAMEALSAEAPGEPPRPFAAPVADSLRAVEYASAPLGVASAAVDGALPPELMALLATARQKSGSDLHLQADQPPRLRVAGRLLPLGEALSRAQVDAFVGAALAPALVPVLAERGSVDQALQPAGAGRFRLNVSREARGSKMCLRVVPPSPATLEELHLPNEVGAVANYHQGLVVFSGPRGHGKTTTMAAIVHAINQRSAVHILTVEDPIEVVHPRGKAVVSQRQIGAHTRSFARALKAALREDPDIIVIGELRDRETVEIAMSAAETGHLVLATMSTRSAAKTVDRLIDLFPPDDQPQVRATLAGALKMVVSQRLLPSLAGGLLPAVEIMTGSVPLWTLIRENKMFQLPSLQQRGASIGMMRLDASLEALVAQKQVDPREAIAAAEVPAELVRVLHDKHGYRPETPVVSGPRP